MFLPISLSQFPYCCSVLPTDISYSPFISYAATESITPANACVPNPAIVLANTSNPPWFRYASLSIS